MFLVNCVRRRLPSSPAVERTAINSFSVYTLNRVNGRRSLVSCLCLFPGIIYYDYYYSRRRRGRRPTDRLCVRACEWLIGGAPSVHIERSTPPPHTFTTAATERCRRGTLYYCNRTTVSYSAPLTSRGRRRRRWWGFCVCRRLRFLKFEIPLPRRRAREAYIYTFTTRSQNPALTTVYLYGYYHTPESGQMVFSRKFKKK